MRRYKIEFFSLENPKKTRARGVINARDLHHANELGKKSPHFAKWGVFTINDYVPKKRKGPVRHFVLGEKHG